MSLLQEQLWNKIRDEAWGYSANEPILASFFLFRQYSTIKI